MRALLKDLRQTIGISQRQLAAFIGGDRTQLVRAENAERNLSDAASLQFLNMVPSYSFAKQAAIPASPITDKCKKGLKRHADECRYKQTTLERKLAQMQQDFEAAARLKMFAEHLQQLPVSVTYTPRQKRWLEQRIYEAKKKSTANSIDNQKLLQIKIAVLQFEIAAYTEALD